MVELILKHDQALRRDECPPCNHEAAAEGIDSFEGAGKSDLVRVNSGYSVS
jgi:hypothetical protein